jgi:hypothetical protein
MGILARECHLHYARAHVTEFPPEMEVEFGNGRRGFVCMNARFLTVVVLPDSVTITGSEADFVVKFGALCDVNTRRRSRSRESLHRDSFLHGALVELARRVSLS